jgi:glutaredoxin
MVKGKLVTAGIVIAILLIAGAVIYSKTVGFAVKDIPSEEVAKYIGNHSVLYVQAGCSHCKDQEDLFGVNVKYLNIIDGIKEKNRQKFIDAGVNEVPTWIINGQKYVGVQSIEKLKELTGYQNQ